LKTLETTDLETRLAELRDGHFSHWEKVKDMIDSMIDMMLNYRQSGHPGGSRSKVHLLVATLLGGVIVLSAVGGRALADLRRRGVRQ